LNSSSIQNSRHLWLVTAVLLLAAGTRIIGAGGFPVWTDEGWSIWAASSHQLDTILNVVAEDRHPPLYFLSLSAWSSLAGESRLALRFLSIAGGILTVAVTYQIGASVFGRRAGLYAALLLSVLGSAVYYSQEVRHYGWLALFTALTWLCFLRYLGKSERRFWVAYVISMALMLYTQYFGVLALGVEALVGLFLWGAPLRRKLKLIGAWGTAGLLYLPWLVVIATQQAGILGSGIAGFPGTIAVTLENLPALGEIVLGSQLALSLGLYMLGAWAILRRSERRQQWTVLRRSGLRGGLIPYGNTLKRGVLLGGGGLFVLVLLLSGRFDFLAPRTLVFLTPLLMVVCGYGLSVMERRAAGILAGSLVVVSLATLQVIQPRLNIGEAAQTISAQVSPDDLVVLEAGWDDNAFAYDLGLALPDGVEIVRTLPWTNDRTGGDPVVPQIESQLAAHDRVWVVQWLQAPQLIPFLATGGLGFRTALSYETPAGDYGESFGDPAIRLRLFERPDLEGEPSIFGDIVHVYLWWSALEAPTLDYSVGVYLLDENGAVRAEHNAAPATSTTEWTPGAYNFDRHTLAIPTDLAPRLYRVGVSVYWYADPTPLQVEGQPYVVVGEVRITE
jgi:4-amino-4-deoxy-L-arabinose transferase-like glycosyltransferase